MSARIPTAGPISNGVRRRLEPLAAQHGVTVERIVEVVRAKRRYRRAAFYRKRARRRVVEKNRFTRKYRPNNEELRAGEGELHGLLKATGLSVAEFCALVGIHPSVFYRWYGNPLHRWAQVVLFHYAWAQNMAKHLALKGFDPAYFHPQMPPQTKAGRRLNPSDLVIQGLSEAEREAMRKKYAVARGLARWKDHKKLETDENYTPWKL